MASFRVNWPFSAWHRLVVCLCVTSFPDYRKSWCSWHCRCDPKGRRGVRIVEGQRQRNQSRVGNRHLFVIWFVRRLVRYLSWSVAWCFFVCTIMLVAFDGWGKLKMVSPRSPLNSRGMMNIPWPRIIACRLTKCDEVMILLDDATWKSTWYRINMRDN